MSETRYDDRVLGYFDILGWSELVRASQERNEIVDLFRVLIDIGDGRRNRPAADSVQYAQFSDHFCISSPKADGFALVNVVAALRADVERLLEMGFATRGAIVIGPLVHSGNVIFGPALLEAHEVESKVAKYPRILLSERALEAAAELAPPRGIPRRMDTDGMSFLDVFEKLTSLEQIDGIRRALEQRAPIQSSLDIKAKQNWLLEHLRQRAHRLGAA